MDEFLTLEQAAKLIPGATKGTLLRRARQGLLRVRRPGKVYVTTESDLMAMIEACKVKVEPTRAVLEIDAQRQMDAANAALDAALARLKSTKTCR